jgi:hypothetical protein
MAWARAASRELGEVPERHTDGNWLPCLSGVRARAQVCLELQSHAPHPTLGEEPRCVPDALAGAQPFEDAHGELSRAMAGWRSRFWNPGGGVTNRGGERRGRSLQEM